MAAAAGGDDGAGTGGKIRSRRYHVSAGRTPYSKNRQPGQQGIIGRVTDTVKSIVPGWLQKYFNKEASASGRVPVTNELLSEHPENDVDHRICVNDESPTPAEGRVTPEPVRLEEEPTTSRFSLNVPDGLTRPSLHRANLNFDVLDSPALHCQPSTSSAFPISGSGFSMAKEIKDSTSQHDDDNISTTSGFSSRASDKDLAVSKSVSAPPLWSPEADRSNSLVHNSSLSAKKPTFNLSAFGALSPSLSNNSVLKSSQLGDSPFYPGKTSYGGAAARSSRVRTTPYQAPLRRQVKAKPANTQSYGVTSSTARRILQSLEKMSSPLADAKRIPSISPLPQEREIADFAELPPKRKKVEASYPPVRQLVTPKPVLLSTNTSLYIKPSLTPSGLNTCRRIQSDRHQEPKRNRLPDAPTAPQPESNFSYPKFSTPASNGLSSAGAGGKMIRERGSHYTAKPADEVLDVPDLPEVPLPLSTAALPSFNFPTMSGVTSPVTAPKTAEGQAQIATLPINTFTFSTPIVKSTASNAQIPSSSVGFTFSAPAVKVSSASNAVDYNTPKWNSPAKTPVLANNTSAKKKDEEQEGFLKPAKTLKEGSVLDILKSPGFSSSVAAYNTPGSVGKSTSPLTKNADSNVPFGDSNKSFGLWECKSCLLENNASDSTCVACSAAKEKSLGVPNPLPSSTTSVAQKSTPPSASFQGFGDLFKVPEGTWDCDTCLVQNKREATKCVACNSPKPWSGVKAPLVVSPKKSETSSAAAPPAAIISSFRFDDKFKKPVGFWECTVCCVQNKAEDKKCVACTSDKPGSSPVKTQTLAAGPPPTGPGLFDQFKKPAGSWDCDVCLVQNKAENTKCVACESAKPGTKQELKGFSSPAQTTGSTASSFKFGLSGNAGELKLGASTNATSTSATSVAFSFPKLTGDFKFGTVSSSPKAPEKDTSLSLGSTIASSNQVPSTFKFGTDNLASADMGKASKQLIGSFSFGKASNVAVTPLTTESSASTGLPSQPAMDKSSLTPSSGLKESSEKKTETPAFSLGSIEQKKELSTFAFGRKDEKTDSTTSGTTLGFGNKREGESQKPFVFGKPEQTTNSSAPSPFVFGESKPADNATDQTAKPAFVFGTQVSSTTITGKMGKDANSSQQSDSAGGAQPSSSAISSNVFGTSTLPSTSNVFGSATPAGTQAVSSGVFGTAPSVAPTNSNILFGIKVPSGSSAGSGGMFGNAAPATTATSTSNVFGSTAQAASSTGSGVMFGSTAPTSTATSTSNIFGSTVSPAPSAGGIFGSIAPTSTASSTSSVFGSTISSGSSSVPGNMFGSAVPTSTAASSSSVFGNTASSGSSASTGLFGSVAAASAATNSSNIFGAGAALNAPASASSIFGSTLPASTTSSTGVFGSTAPATTSANSNSIFGSTGTATNAQSGAFVFGQPTSTASGPVFGNQTESKSTHGFSGTENNPVSSSSTATVSPFVFGSGASNTPASSGFNFGSTNAPGTNPPFIFGAGQTPAAPAVLSAANPVPAFGQNASQSSAPAFGSSAAAPLFPAGSQSVPAFGSLTNSAQPPMFGQQATQPAFGSNAAPATGAPFQFGGNTSFNFAGGSSSSSPGVFAFGSNAAGAPGQPAAPGFPFNQTPTFTMGASGKTASSIANRKIKTARRRK